MESTTLGGIPECIKKKADYIFRNYKKAAGKTVIFPGCNFPSLFPKTNKAFAAMMKREYGYGIAYDWLRQTFGTSWA